MFFKGKNKYIFFAAVVFTFFYVFITPMPMGRDIYLMPEWAVSVLPASAGLSGFQADPQPAGAPRTDEADQSPIGFILGNYFGYFAEDGRILKSEPVRERISLSSYGWTVYSEKSASAQIYSPEGTPITAIEEPGFVFVDDDRLFLFEPGGSAVQKYGQDGSKQWRHIHTAPITAFDSSAGGAVIGHSDGMLSCIDSAGNNIFNFYPGGSKYQVIMGAAVSDDGKQIICVCGLEQQRLILISVIDNHYKIVHHAFLKKDVRRQVFADFEEKSRFAVFESAGGIGITDGKELKTSCSEEYGTIIDAGIEPKKNILTALVKNGGEYSLLMSDLPDFIIGKTAFTSDDAFLIRRKDRLYLGANNKISAFEIRGLK